MRPETPELDHLVVGCLDLSAGTAEMTRRLGVEPGGGGAHDGAGTHNVLWGLEDARRPGARPVYLELIAPDPAQDAEPRSFGLARPEVRALLASGPRLLTWMARCGGIDDLAARASVDLGPVGPLRRGDLAWRLTRAPGPVAPFWGAVPGLIEWPEGVPTPSETLAGGPLHLVAFERRADPDVAKALLSLDLSDAVAEADPDLPPPAAGAGAALRAVIDSPAGRVFLD